jgi:heat shock protein HtpX
VIVVILVVLSPILVRLLYLATSRWREYLADASAARFTRYPEGLASALEKISAWYAAGSASAETSSALAALYIFNPVEKFAASSWFSTHPPTENRIKILRGMGGRAGYVDYEAALRKIESRNLAALHAAAISEASIAARAPSAEPGEASGEVARAKEVADLLDYMAHYVVVHCACGMNIKLPPDSKQDRIMCPRCMLWHNVPAVVPAKTEAQAATPEVPAPELPAISGSNAGWKYERREEGREAFRCVCGQTIQIGPDYPLDYTVCVKCERRISLRAGQQAQATANVEPVA